MTEKSKCGVNVSLKRVAEKVRLKKVTWPVDTEPERLPHKRGRSVFNEVSFTDCTSNWFALWLMAGFSRDDEPSWGDDDWKAYLEVVRSLESGLAKDRTESTMRVVDHGKLLAVLRFRTDFDAWQQAHLCSTAALWTAFPVAHLVSRASASVISEQSFPSCPASQWTLFWGWNRNTASTSKTHSTATGRHSMPTYHALLMYGRSHSDFRRRKIWRSSTRRWSSRRCL